MHGELPGWQGSPNTPVTWHRAGRCAHQARSSSALLIPQSGNVPIDVKHKYWRVQLCKPMQQGKQIYFQSLNAWHTLKESSDEAFKEGPSKAEHGAVPTLPLNRVCPYTAARPSVRYRTRAVPQNTAQVRARDKALSASGACASATSQAPHVCEHACNSSQLEEKPSRLPRSRQDRLLEVFPFCSPLH